MITDAIITALLVYITFLLQDIIVLLKKKK